VNDSVDQVGTKQEPVEQILAIVREVLARPEVTADDDVFDHGGTSLAVIRVLAETRRTLGLRVNPRDLAGSVTARSLADAAR
jgi:acyl carrier protein